MIYDEMNTGDLILFAGVNSIARVISMASRSEYTHVGLVLKIRGKLCLLESTIHSTEPDALSLQVQDGVSIYDLKKRVEHVKAAGESLWWGPRTEPLTQEQEDKLVMYALGVQGSPYDYVEAARSAIDIIEVWNRSTPDKLFCSELVVRCELAIQGQVYHPKHRVPINPSEVVPGEVIDLHIGGVPIWGPIAKL